MRTQQEIEHEVSALKALRPIGPFKKMTAQKIAMAVEELEYGYDDTSEEWDELCDNERDVINMTRRWKEGDIDDRPSKGWGGLVVEKGESK